MRVTIFGATGMLGKALMRQWTGDPDDTADGDEVTGFGSAQADIRVSAQVGIAIRQSKPDWIALAAAYTDVDGCELNPTLASSVNTLGAVNVARAVAAAGAKLLFVSTDYVFDGTKSTPYEPDDLRNPINAYGRSKAEAEEKILAILPDACIVRTSWLFGPGGKCFPDTILKLAATLPETEVVTVVNDQRGCPTYTLDLARAIAALCKSEARGIIHCTNREDCTWYDFASEIIRQAGLKTIVRPTTSQKFVRPAPRPRYSVLSSSSLSRYGIEMRPWQEAASDYLSRRAANE
jgi:dTDP-4-dehydrorhamnose reductase